MTELIQKYLSYLRYEKNYSLHTEISYSKDLSQFKDYVDEETDLRNLLEVDSDIVRRWMASLIEKGVTSRSVNRKLSSLKSFYRYNLRLGLITASPTENIVAPKMKKGIPSFANDSDLDFVFDDTSDVDDFEELRDLTIVKLFYLTGIRRAELIGLKLEDVDFYLSLIKVTGKRNKQRLIPISDTTKSFLEKYLSERNKQEDSSSAFFIRKNGQPLYPMFVQRVVHSYLESVSTLRKASPHVLRHSFATNMLNNGAEINAVKELLGHSSLASTEVYTHTSFEELKNIYKKAHPRA